MSKWDEVEAKVEAKEASNSLWLKLPEDGDKAVVVFLGDPHFAEVAYIDNKPVPMTPELRAQGAKPRVKISINVAIYPGTDVKVFDMSASTFKDLNIARKKYGLNKWAFELARYGKDLKTVYKIMPERQLTDDEQRMFARVELHDLEKISAGKSDDERPSSPAPAQNADAKFRELVNAGRVLSESQRGRFYAHFKIGKLNELSDRQLDEALRFVHMLANENAASPNAEAAEDDFPHGYNEPGAQSMRPEQPTRPEGVR